MRSNSFALQYLRHLGSFLFIQSVLFMCVVRNTCVRLVWNDLYRTNVFWHPIKTATRRQRPLLPPKSQSNEVRYFRNSTVYRVHLTVLGGYWPAPSFHFLDVLTVMNDREKRRRCVDRKGRRTCKNFEMFFYSCTHKMMKKYCRATCRKCKMLLT